MSPHLPPVRIRPARARVALTLALAALPSPALAGPADDDEPLLSPRAELDPRLDLPEPSLAERPTSPLHAPYWVAISGLFRQPEEGATQYGAMLLLGLPLDRLHARDVPVSAIGEGPGHHPPPPPADAVPPPTEPPAAEIKPPPRTKPGDLPPPPKLAPAQPGGRPAPIHIPVVVTPSVARDAVDAALRRAKLVDPDARLDAFAARTRSAAGLPELRLRVLRTVDTGDALSPTEYDPTRVTTKAGATFWVEARATWRLDRLLFAEEEISLERMRHEREDARTKLSAQVLKLLFEWQRALAQEDNPAASPEEQLAARLKVVETEAEIDLWTDGWLSRWRARKAR